MSISCSTFERSESMCHSLKRIVFSLMVVMLLAGLAACNSSNPTKVPANPYALRGGGSCVRLGAHPRGPYVNVRVSHDGYLDHSEPMVVEDPGNPLHLVGGSKFFTDPAHYR